MWTPVVNSGDVNNSIQWVQAGPKYVQNVSFLLGARMLLGAPGLTTRNKKLLGAKGIATRSKGHRY